VINFIFWIVGPGGSPDENGETTIDALVMDGVTIHHLNTVSYIVHWKVDRFSFMEDDGPELIF